MPTNRTAQRTPPALTRKDIEEIARSAARDEVRRLLDSDMPVPEMSPEPEPPPVHPQPTERHFTAYVASEDGEKQLHGIQHADGRIFTSNPQRTFASRSEFLSKWEPTPSRIEWEEDKA
jgi:hypothetical protein